MGTGLASWVGGTTRSAITDFVARVTDPGGPDFVEPASRVAVFDNDGTLWTEKPLVIQLDFTIRRMARLAEDDPALRTRQPYQAAYDGDHEWLNQAMVKHYQGDDTDLKLLMATVPQVFEALAVEEYDDQVADFFAGAANPVLKRPYRTCTYAPMVELLRYLEAHDFVTYIASGGDRDFMRPVADELYGIPPERIIGSALGITFAAEKGGSTLLYKGAMDFFDDGPEKPVRIWSRIGRRPILSCGNSNGDLPMLAYSELTGRPALRLVIRHDDADREFDYVAGVDRILDTARGSGWTIVSMKDDWSDVFTESAETR
jgi:phosphoglycolate phosphatase-like HAD superfamily hydrolase